MKEFLDPFPMNKEVILMRKGKQTTDLQST